MKGENNIVGLAGWQRKFIDSLIAAGFCEMIEDDPLPQEATDPAAGSAAHHAMGEDDDDDDGGGGGGGEPAPLPVPPESQPAPAEPGRYQPEPESEPVIGPEITPVAEPESKPGLAAARALNVAQSAKPTRQRRVRRPVGAA